MNQKAGVLPPPAPSLSSILNCVNLGKVITLFWSCWPQVYHVHLNCGETYLLLSAEPWARLPAVTGLPVIVVMVTSLTPALLLYVVLRRLESPLSSAPSAPREKKPGQGTQGAGARTELGPGVRPGLAVLRGPTCLPLHSPCRGVRRFSSDRGRVLTLDVRDLAWRVAAVSVPLPGGPAGRPGDLGYLALVQRWLQW